MTNASVSAPSVSQVAPTTSSPSRNEITSNSSERTGHSGAHTLTTPCRVPSASPGEPCADGPSGARPTTVSPGSSGTSSAADMPPRSDTVPDCSGSTGSGSTSILKARPALVTSSTRPRAVECTTARTASCLTRPLRRRASAASSDSAAVRATSPVAERITWHGSSATSSGPAGTEAASTSLRSPSTSVVRRGAPNCLTTAASSSETTFRSTFGSSRIFDSSAISPRSFSCSASSSSRSYLVSRRSGVSRM